jgi:hypothetical protein
MIAEIPSNYWYFISMVIPIIIHLFFFRKIREILFSNLDFLKSIVQNNKKSRKLQHIFQLVLRLFFLFFLILSFLGFNRTDSTSDNHVRNIFFVDNSLSSGIPSTEGKQMINHSLEYVSNIFTGTTAGTESYLLDADLIGLESINQYNKNEKLSKITFVNNGKELSEVIDFVKNRFDQFKLNYVSDFQQSTTLSGEIVESSAEINLIQIKPEQLKNVFVDTISLQSLFLSPFIENILNVRLAVSGDVEIQDPVQLKILNDNVLLSTHLVPIEQGKGEIEIPIDYSALISHNLTLEIVDTQVTYDNIYYLRLPEYDAPTIVQLYNENLNRYVHSVFNNDRLFDFHLMNVSTLDYQVLENVDLLVIDGLFEIPNFVNSIHKKHIMVIPPPTLDEVSYEKLLGSRIETISENSKSELKKQVLTNSFVGGAFLEVQEEVKLPEVALKYSVSNYDEIILKDQFDREVLTKHRASSIDNANRYFFSCPFELSSTNIMTHALFVPLMYGIAFESKSFQSVFAHRLDEQYVKLAIDKEDHDSHFEIRGPGMSFVPNQIFNEEYVQFELPPDLSEPGYYYVIESNDTVGTFALNRAKSESIMKFEDEEALIDFANRYENVNYHEITAPQTTLEAGINKSTKLWQYALVLAIFCLLGEVIVAKYL